MANQIHSDLVNSPKPGNSKTVDVADRSRLLIASIIFVFSSCQEASIFSFSMGSFPGKTKSGDFILVVKSRNMVLMASTFSSGFLVVGFVSPYNNSGIPETDFRICSDTWPAVQLPAKGTVLNFSSGKDSIACNSLSYQLRIKDFNTLIHRESELCSGIRCCD